MARPTKITPELAEAFAAEIEDGLPIDYVCDLLGVTRTTYGNWMRLGEEEADDGNEGVYYAFFALIKKSYAKWVKTAKAKIREGAPGWQGTAWWLERTNSKFMPKQQIQADDEGKVTVVIGGNKKKVRDDYDR